MTARVHTTLFKVILASALLASVALVSAQGQIILGQSTQTVTLTGLGNNSNGQGVSRITWGTCTYDGTNTTCTVSGPFTGIGSGGTYAFILKYPGNGQSPLNAVSETPGSNYFNFSLSAGSFTNSFTETNGPTFSFTTPTESLAYVNPTCTDVTPCGVAAVGATPGATITGPFTGTFNSTPQIQTTISAGSYGGFAAIAPATWVEIYGVNLATTTEVWGSSNFTGNNAPTALGNTTVTIGGQSAFIDYVSPAQVNAQVPSNVATGSQPVVVTTLGGSSAPFSVTVNSTQPGLLAPSVFDVQGTQYAVALFPNQLYVLPPNAISGVASARALPGNTILLYGIGFGPVTPDNPAGVIEQTTNSLTGTLDVQIGGTTAQVSYAGLTPSFVGLYQFNVVIPQVSASDKTPLTFTLNGTPGAQTLYLAIGN